tara:strand:- start:12856 stop:13152 length:297 start_codon:yes stop_codon:yes gene_type:complete
MRGGGPGIPESVREQLRTIQSLIEQLPTGSIPQVSTDPASPAAEDAWVLRSGSGGAIADGTPIGLLLALTYTGNAGTSFSYQFSYRTNEGTTIRANLA